MTGPAPDLPPANSPEQLDRYGRDLTGFTPRERLFIAEYPVDWNKTQAAIRAGYSPKSAKDIGYELTLKPKIIDAITAYLAKREDKAEISRGWVLAKLVDVEAECARVAHEKDATGKGVARLHRLRALELIGRHVDVNAFKAHLGGGDASGSSLWDLSRLTDEELDEFERLLAKISLTGGDAVREDHAATAAGEGEDRAES